MSFEDLVENYTTIGTEGHKIASLLPILSKARENSETIKLQAGFIPRTYAKMVMRNTEQEAIEQAISKGYLDKNFKELTGSELHYNIFESMFTGRDIFNESMEPNTQFKQIFKAQLIKDYAMANKIKDLLEADTEKKDQFLVIAGSGHMSYFTGIYELLFNNTDSATRDEAIMLICRPNDNVVDNKMEDKELIKNMDEYLVGNLGGSWSYPGEYLFLFNENEADVINSEEKGEEKVVKETADAYNQVGQAAHIKGNIKLAHAMMKYLGYSEDMFNIVKDFAYNYQGVGCPHNFVQINKDEKVLDVGSGLGVDSVIALHYVGENGSVTGIDIAKNEVHFANNMASNLKTKGVGGNLDF